MEMNEYQQAALQTAVYPQEMKIVYPLIGITGETGEVAEKIKKVIRDNNAVFSDDDRREIAKEIGDILWYISSLSSDIGYSLDEIAAMNIDKITSRNERGKIHGEGDNR